MINYLKKFQLLMNVKRAIIEEFEKIQLPAKFIDKFYHEMVKVQKQKL